MDMETHILRHMEQRMPTTQMNHDTNNEVERLKALPHHHHESNCRVCGRAEMVTETMEIK
jgi:hypothetical protein